MRAQSHGQISEGQAVELRFHLFGEAVEVEDILAGRFNFVGMGVSDPRLMAGDIHDGHLHAEPDTKEWGL